MWGINARFWLPEYLQACAVAGGKTPADLDPLLPSNRPEAKRPESRRAALPQVLDSSEALIADANA